MRGIGTPVTHNVLAGTASQTISPQVAIRRSDTADTFRIGL